MGVTIARSHLIDTSRCGAYHLISRCVRRAFLCGDAVDHRREWVTETLQRQCASFGIDVLAYAVMSNHFHLVVRVDPARSLGRTTLQVAERWCALFPQLDDTGVPQLPPISELQALADDAGWVSTRRQQNLGTGISLTHRFAGISPPLA